MDQHIRTSIQTNTFYYFMIVLAITTFAQLLTMVVIVFGDISGKEHLVAASVIGPALLGAFGVIRMLTNMKLIIGEMDADTLATNYGKEISAIPLNVLKFIFSGIFVALAIVQLITIY